LEHFCVGLSITATSLLRANKGHAISHESPVVQPPYDRHEPPIVRTESLGLGYITSVLRLDGHDVEIVDAQLRCLHTRDTIREIIARKFDCVGFTAADAHKKTLVRIVREVRRSRKDALIIAGGYLPTLAAKQLLGACPELDFLVRGEGEQVISEALARISAGRDWRDTPGLAYSADKTAILNAFATSHSGPRHVTVSCKGCPQTCGSESPSVGRGQPRLSPPMLVLQCAQLLRPFRANTPPGFANPRASWTRLSP